MGDRHEAFHASRDTRDPVRGERRAGRGGRGSTSGTWSPGAPAPGSLLATHSTLLRTSKILVVGGSRYD
jgi:hypothetical protein